MSKTNVGLLEYARSKISTPYIYGAKMEVLTEDKFKYLQKVYGKSLVWDSDAGKIGKVCCDCSGLISSYTGILRSSAGYKTSAKLIHPISTISEAPIGSLVWLNGHIGIYSGILHDIPYYVAEDGSAYGCREVPLSCNKFTNWFLCNDIEYLEDEQEEEMVKYATYNDVPDWGKPAVKAAMSKQGKFNGAKVLNGDEKGNLNLTDSDLKSIVREWQLGLYE